MRLAGWAVFLTQAWIGAPPPILNKDARANLKTEGPPSLGGILGFAFLVTLGVIVAHSLYYGPLWYTIAALSLFVVAAGLLFWKIVHE